MINLSETTLMWFIVHFIVDYYIMHPNKLEKQMLCKFSSSLIIYITLFGCFLKNNSWKEISFLFITSIVSHTLVYYFNRNLNKSNTQKFTDNSIPYTFIRHVGLQVFILLLIVILSQSITPLKSFLPLVFYGVPTRTILQWLLLIILMHSPANTTMKIAFEKFQVPDKKVYWLQSFLDDKTGNHITATIPGAGALIGTMERLITCLLMDLGQYALIGLIFTSKSVARFDRISKDQAFAEYYLLGTLYSVLFVIIAYRIIF